MVTYSKLVKFQNMKSKPCPAFGHEDISDAAVRCSWTLRSLRRERGFVLSLRFVYIDMVGRGGISVEES